MRISTPITMDIVGHFAKVGGGLDGYTHYFYEADGSVECFKMEHCDHCGAECRGPNSVIFTKEACHNRKSVFSFPPLKLTKSNVTDELGCNDEGSAVCPKCYEEGSVEA